MTVFVAFGDLSKCRIWHDLRDYSILPGVLDMQVVTDSSPVPPSPQASVFRRFVTSHFFVIHLGKRRATLIATRSETSLCAGRSGGQNISESV